MDRIFTKYFICEEGHITAGNEKKTKCDAKEWQIQYVKGKRKKWDAIKKETGPCGKKIVDEKEIPQVLDLSKVWDFDVMHAFLIGQKLDASFMIAIQKQFADIWERINGKE
jgi:hypothetical protein